MFINYLPFFGAYLIPTVGPPFFPSQFVCVFPSEMCKSYLQINCNSSPSIKELQFSKQ